ncbi:MAG: lmo0937 family membrane protein [Candidatus Gracilibacteria bacterium]|nr:lmo0937 family membrane protein [Candidatus Gracilibacteria bacterium]
MLFTIAIILIILWLIGFISFHVIGSFIHILLVIAIIMILIRIIKGK